jgi:hypothetical protein
MNPKLPLGRALPVLAALFLTLPLGLRAQCSSGNAICVGSDCTSTGHVEYASGSSILPTTDNNYVFQSFKENRWGDGYSNGSVRTNTSIVRVGTESIKHTIWGPDKLDSGIDPDTGLPNKEAGKRAELSDIAIQVHPIKDASGNYYYYWYGWSYYIPDDANWTTAVNPKVAGDTGFRQFIGQWRFNNTAGCVAMSRCDATSVGGSGHHLILNNGRLILTLVIDDTSCATANRLKEIDFDLGTPVKGKWMDFVVQTKWTSASTGMMKVWLQKNGGGYTEVMNYSGPTWLKKYNDNCGFAAYIGSDGKGVEPMAPNWQLGMYWSDDAPLVTAPRVMYTDEPKMDRTLCSTSYGSEAWNYVVPVAGTLNSSGTSGTATVTEMEKKSFSVSVGDSVAVITDTTASGGKYVKFTANAIADSVQTGITPPTAGTYNVKVRARRDVGVGTADLYVNNVRIGSWDQYSSPSDYYEKDCGNIALIAGSNAFKWVLTGKNAASTGYNLTFDKITLTVP